jgi:cyclic di-GMP phosphodiesterase
VSKRARADILVVDDTPANLRLLTEMLAGEGFGVRAVPSGHRALKAAEQQAPDLILMDINMPDMDGYETCAKLKENPDLDDIPVIFISALTETADKLRAFESGGVDYVTKPFRFPEVLARVRTHLTLRQLRRRLALHNQQLTEMVHEAVREIADSQMATIFAMSKLAESRDDDTGKHLERTQIYCRLLADRLREESRFRPIIDERFMENIYCASPLHDIGKVGIPDRILCKPGKLTEEEYEEMKKHTTQGAETLAQVADRYPGNSFINMGVEIARWHHEKWNGNGYPDRLKGEEIPLSALIMAVADVYDALTSERCYKKAFPHEEAVRILRAESGEHFAPYVISAFLDLESEFHQIRIEMGA